MKRRMVSGLYIYPVKSCRGISLDEAEVGERGFMFDREWMIVDDNGRFVTQREEPKLARIVTSIEDDPMSDGKLLRITVPIGDSWCSIAIPDIGGETARASVWNDSCLAKDEGKRVSLYLSGFLGRSVRLVRVLKEHPRGSRSDGPAKMGFADGYPFLVTSRPSLADLWKRAGERIPMDRFRPNIVVTGCDPYEEDRWDEIDMNGVSLSGETRCVRCAITTVDQETGERGKEPLRTLAKYRRVKDGVVFGRNFDHLNAGVIRVGDEVEVRRSL